MKSNRRGEKTKRPEKDAGYTLMELLVVLAVLALLAVIITPTLMGRLSKAKSDSAALHIDSLISTVEMFYLDMGRFPTDEEGLDVLWKAPMEKDNWNGPYVRKPANLVDPWGEKYHYARPGLNTSFDIYSFGADGARGGEGEDKDIGSWPEGNPDDTSATE